VDQQEQHQLAQLDRQQQFLQQRQLSQQLLWQHQHLAKQQHKNLARQQQLIQQQPRSHNQQITQQPQSAVITEHNMERTYRFTQLCPHGAVKFCFKYAAPVSKK
jgi:hypothetical protein